MCCFYDDMFNYFALNLQALTFEPVVWRQLALSPVTPLSLPVFLRGNVVCRGHRFCWCFVHRRCCRICWVNKSLVCSVITVFKPIRSLLKCVLTKVYFWPYCQSKLASTKYYFLLFNTGSWLLSSECTGRCVKLALT